MEHVIYVYFSWKYGEREHIHFTRNEYGMYVTYDVCFENAYGNMQGEKIKRKWKKQIRKFQKHTRKWDKVRIGFGTDRVMGKVLGIEENEYYGRKEEFQINKDYILKKLRESTMENCDSGILFVVDGDSNMREEDIYRMITAAKDYYKRIGLWDANGMLECSLVRERIRKEWGVYVNVYEGGVANCEGYEVVCVFAANHELPYIPLSDSIYYIVGNNSCMYQARSKNYKRVYGGLAYSFSSHRVPGRMVRELMLQCPGLYVQNEVSVIDICRLK